MARKLIETGNLSSQLSIKDDAEVMLKTNINIKDWLVNGLTSIVLTYVNNEDNIEYVKFNSNNSRIAETPPHEKPYFLSTNVLKRWSFQKMAL